MATIMPTHTGPMSHAPPGCSHTLIGLHNALQQSCPVLAVRAEPPCSAVSGFGRTVGLNNKPFLVLGLGRGSTPREMNGRVGKQFISLGDLKLPVDKVDTRLSSCG